jgi:hypothetical protein
MKFYSFNFFYSATKNIIFLPQKIPKEEELGFGLILAKTESQPKHKKAISYSSNIYLSIVS